MLPTQQAQLKPEIIITVHPDGTTTVEAINWQGPSCALLTEPYRKVLGEPVKYTPKAEFFLPDKEAVRQNINQK